MNNKYVVKSGDTLSGIASKYGLSWQDIYNANKGVIGGDPNLIRAGQTLTIGGSSSSSSGAKASTPTLSSAAQGYQQVTNELKKYEQETQTGLSKYQTDREKIYQDNLAKGNEIVDKSVEQQIATYEREKEKLQEGVDTQSRANYVQYQQTINPYGAQSEGIQEMGLARSGFSETTKARAYSSYQKSISEMYNKAQDITADFNLKMNEAIAQGDIQKAQILIQENDRRLADVQFEYEMQTKLSQIRLQIAESERNFRYQIEKDQRLYGLEQEKLALQRQIAEWDKIYKDKQLAVSRGAIGSSGTSTSSSGNATIDGWSSASLPPPIAQAVPPTSSYGTLVDTIKRAGRIFDVYKTKTANGSSMKVVERK